jgi:DNA-binding beta-propeller fold protein YncE/4-amino-4-deoxy-L-arabinose transferase-like glycosyltransferase
MSEVAQDLNQRRALDRSVDLTRVTWWAVAAASIVAVSAGFRLVRLDWLSLSPPEAIRSFYALAFYDGRPLDAGQSIPDTSPLFLILQALSYLLFGTSDVSARLPAALAGIGIVVVALAMRPYVGRSASLMMALFAALSPTLLFSSRIADPEIVVGFFAFFTFYAFLRVGSAPERSQSQTVWAGVVGFSLASMLASDPVSISVMLALAVGLAAGIISESGSRPFLGPSARAFARPRNLLAFAVVLVALSIFFFSRAFTSITALRGIPDTIVDWANYVARDPSTTPSQYFLMALLLYEIAAVFAAVTGFALLDDDRERGLTWMFFLGWFIAALVLFSFSSGRSPNDAVHVALPLVLWGGASAGALVSGLDWRPGWAGRNTLTIGAFVALFAAIAALIAAVLHIGGAADETQATLEAISIAIIAVVPLIVGAYALVRGYHGARSARWWARPVMALLLAVLVYLGAYTVRSTILLSFERAAGSAELVAERTSTRAIGPLVERIKNVSRDLTVAEGSTQDPMGGHGLSIAMDARAQWPFRWYFRDFPMAVSVPEGTAPTSGNDIVIAPDSTGMDQAGYAHRSYAVLNRVPPQYLDPSIANVLGTIVNPNRWDDGVRFLLFREAITIPEPQSVSVGYGARVAPQLFPASGPYSLGDRPGPGTGRGQFRQPRGIAVAPVAGTVFVVDMSNGRIQRFDAAGDFIGAWGAEEGNVVFEVTAEGLGPTGVTLGTDGLLYVTDTWGHRIVVLNQSGQVVRQFGSFADTLDSPDPTVDAGMFFGPRDVVMFEDEIYVVDTGNERVQVFAPDGTFLRAWGGYGSEPNQLIEPVGIAIDSEGRIYVADSGNSRISVFARTGTPLEQWTVPAWEGNFFFEPYLAFDQAGRLYATSSATGSVEVFDRTGQHLESITQVGNEVLESPVGIAASGDGRIYISDRDRSAVLIYSPPPAPIEIATPAVVVDEFEATPPATPEATPIAVSDASPVATPEGVVDLATP